MRRFVLTLALSTTLGLAGPALAALPSSGEFTGTTSVHSMNGFPDLVTFQSSAAGRKLRQFQFGTLGCMGTGSFPLGVDPFAQDYTLATVALVPVSAQGAILVTTTPTFPDAGGIVTSVTITGTFTSPKAVHGTIAVSQSENGSKCVAKTMKFSAVPGTPDSLGYQGP